MIPIRDANPTSRFAWVTLALIIVNAAVFLLWEPIFKTSQAQQVFFFCHAEIPWETTHRTVLAQGGPEAALQLHRQLSTQGHEVSGRAAQRFLQRECPAKSWWGSVLVAMFLHGGWLHLGGNMLFLWVFGNNVED